MRSAVILTLVALMVLAGVAISAQIDLTGGGNSLSSTIGATITSGSKDQARVTIRDFGPISIYGIFATANSTSISVTPYVSVDGTYWYPLYGQANSADSSLVYSFTGTTAASLKVATPLVFQAKLPGTNALTSYGLQPGTRLKIVVGNTGAASITSGQWWLVTNEHD